MALRLAAGVLLAIGVLSGSSPASGIGSAEHRQGARRLDTLVVGPVQSHLLRAFKRNMGSKLHFVRKAGLTRPIDLVIIDGDHAAPATLAGLASSHDGDDEAAGAGPLLLRAIQSTRWVMVLDSSKSDERHGLSHLTGFYPGGNGNAVYLMRRLRTSDGVPRCRILTETLPVYKHPLSRARAHALQGRTARVVSVLRHALTQPLPAAARVEARAAENRPSLPRELLKAQWHIGPEIATFRQISASSGNQTPAANINYYYDAYLAQESKSTANPTGKYQIIIGSIDGSFSPKSANERFIKDYTTDFGVWDSRGWWTGAVEPSWKTSTGAGGAPLFLVKSDPATPNEETKYTSGTSYEFGAELSSEGPTGSAKVTVSNAKEYTVKNWVVRNASSGNDAAWRFSARDPCDVRNWPPSIYVCFDGWGHPYEPNELSKGALDFHLSTIWRTKTVSTGLARFDSSVRGTLVRTWCTHGVGALCSRDQIDSESVFRTFTQAIDLNSVVPVPVEKVSFRVESANARSWPYGQSIAVVAGTTVVAQVKLARPAPWDVTIVVSKKERDGRDLDPNDNLILNKDAFEIKKGMTEGTFRLDTTANSLNPDGVKTVPLGVFYDGFTRAPLTVCASAQAAPCKTRQK